MLSDWTNIILATFVALMPILNPFSTAAVFLGMTRGDSDAKRKHQALKGCMYAFFILVTFLVAGSLIMEFFGISIPGLRIAGGLMVARIGMGMLKPAEDEENTDKSLAEAAEKDDISFTPLAMPSLSGPGAIAVTVGLATTASHWSHYLAIIAGISIVITFCWLVLRASTRIVPLLGENGMNAMSRIMGFLLLCVGVQFIVNGVIGVVVEEGFLMRLAQAYRTATT